MGQPKRHSLAESILNVAVGFDVSLAAQKVVFPWFGIHIGITDNLIIGAIFTFVSLARSYLLRRAFNAWHLRA